MKKKIALVLGGYTGESVISEKSAKTIAGNLDADLYDVYRIVISKEKWVYTDEGIEDIPVDRNDFSITKNGHKITFDMAFIIIHGTPGEDGKLQGYFDMIGLPYNTCDSITSAITMNKSYTKQILSDIDDLFIARSVQLFAHTGYSAEAVLQKLKLPLFVKPNNGGSSIGMSKVNEAADLQAALEKAFAEDEQVIVEEFIKGREFTVGVARLANEIRVLPCTEIVSSKEFFDYEAKYTPGVTNEITPGRMTEEERQLVEKVAVAIYERLNCKGVVRIDYIFEDVSNKMFVLEINTVPGQSQNSLIPQQVSAMGMSLKDFYGMIVEQSLLKTN